MSADRLFETGLDPSAKEGLRGGGAPPIRKMRAFKEAAPRRITVRNAVFITPAIKHVQFNSMQPKTRPTPNLGSS
jgi:hypothetical protein